MALQVEYEGTNYSGFQFQPSQPTIQGSLEEALGRFTGESIRVRGASRTDSGAHAEGQVVDFLTGSSHPLERFPPALNYYLPRDIKVVNVAQVRHDFSSRRSATGRVYRYRILARAAPSPLRRHSHFWAKGKLDARSMSDASRNLLGTHDFRAVASGHPIDKSAVRTVKRWDVALRGEEIVIESEANGFLKQQIRRVNGILVEIGRGKQPVEHMQRTLQGVEVGSCSPALPAHGLCLIEVKYPVGIFDTPRPEDAQVI